MTAIIISCSMGKELDIFVAVFQTSFSAASIA
jgi:hypothetical protein